MCIPPDNARHSKGNGNGQAEHVPPVRDFRIRPHQSVVHVQDPFLRDWSLLQPQIVKQSLEAHGDLVPMVEDGVRERRGINGEEKHVDDNIACSQVGRRVSGVLVRIEQPVVVSCLGNVVQIGEAVVDSVGVDRQVAGVVYILVPENQHDPKRGENTDEAVQRAEERDHEWIGRIPQEHIPIPRGERIQSQAVVDACDNVQVSMARGDPADPVKFG